MECTRCAMLQQQVADRDRFIQIDQAGLKRRGIDIDRLREQLAAAEGRAARLEAALRGLSYLLDDGKTPCWCRDDPPVPWAEHTEPCEQARAALAEPGGGEKA